jgi:uncharacterized membrane-anchored protein
VRTEKKITKPSRRMSARPKQIPRQGVLRELGPLRIGLLLLALTVMLLAPKPGTPAVYGGWQMIPTLMAPVLAPILLQVLLLDALMSRVWMSAYTGAARARYRRILWVNLGVAALTTLWWLPYFMAIASGKGMG